MGGQAGSSLNGPLVLLSNTLYGTAYYSGNYYGGTIFKIKTDGSGFAVLRQFTRSNDGASPYGGLRLRGTTLYGTTAAGGASGNGTVFKIKPDGTDFAILKSFAGSDGRFPYGELTWAGANLYGTTM